MFMIGCADTENLKSDEPKVVNGKLAFNDYSDLEGLILGSNGKEKSTSEVEEKAKSLGLKSHLAWTKEMEGVPTNVRYKARQEGGDEISQYLSPTDDSIRLSSVVDEKLAALLNEQQEITIKGLVHKVQNDYIFVFAEGKEGLVKEYYRELHEGKVGKPSGKEPLLFNTLKIYKTEVKTASNLATSTSNGRSQAGCNVNFNDGAYLLAEVTSSWYFFRSTACIRAFVNKKVGRRCSWFSCSDIWQAQSCDRIANYYDIWVFLDGRFAERLNRFDESPTGRNTTELRRDLPSITGWNVAKYDFSGWLCSGVKYQFNNFRSCSIGFYDQWLQYSPITCPI
jgi:hypothetical protein